MTATENLIAQVYAAFNRRDIDAVFAHLSEDISWPRASEGGRVRGKDEIRAYWTRQWQEFDPHVEPIEILDHESGKTYVRVHQIVRTLTGELLSGTEIGHIYSIAGGLIERMDIEETGIDSDQASSLAFFRS